MNKVFLSRDVISTVGGLLGGLIMTAFGGWSEGLTTLLILMIVDYLSGLIVAGLFKNSPKTENGCLESRAGWKGLARKVLTLVIVMIAYRIDLIVGTTYLMNAAVIGFILNELISITENAGLMGVPLPSAITKAIEVLTEKEGGEE